MFDTIVERLSTYWDLFIQAPIEIKAVATIAVFVGVSAATGGIKNVWKIAFPIRWVASKTLNGAAFLLYKNKNKPTVLNTEEKCLYFDTSSEENFKKTLDCYRQDDRVCMLTDDQLLQLRQVGKHFHCYNYEYEGYVPKKVIKFVEEERIRRQRRRELELINKTYGDKQPKPEPLQTQDRPKKNVNFENCVFSGTFDATSDPHTEDYENVVIEDKDGHRTIKGYWNTYEPYFKNNTDAVDGDMYGSYSEYIQSKYDHDLRGFANLNTNDA